MGGLFGMKSAPATPAPPPAPEIAPDIAKAQRLSDQEQADAMRRRKGRASTVLSKGLLAEAAPTATKTLVGM
jgi:hypothetical protein